MAQTVTATEAKANLSGLIEWAIENQDAVIVQSYGNPKAAIISYTDYEHFLQWQEEMRRKAALAKLEAVAAAIQARNQDLNEAEANELADRFARDVVADMIAEGKIQYSGKQP